MDEQTIFKILASKYTVRVLGQRMGVSGAAVHKYVRGIANPTEENLQRWADSEDELVSVIAWVIGSLRAQAITGKMLEIA